MAGNTDDVRFGIGDEVVLRPDLNDERCGEFKLEKGKRYKVENTEDVEGEQWITVDSGKNWLVKLSSGWFVGAP